MHITPELEAELNAEPIEKAVDKVLDGIDATKVRESLIEFLDEVDLDLYDCDSSDLADEILKHFIITPRS